jgi:hypothetical protein
VLLNKERLVHVEQGLEAVLMHNGQLALSAEALKTPRPSEVKGRRNAFAVK